jgi:hypothetical protein
VIVLADLLLLAAGNGLIVLVAGPARGAFGVVGRIGVGFLAGVALLGITTTLLAVAGLPTSPLPFTAPLLVVVAAAALVPLRNLFVRLRHVSGPLTLLAEVAAAVPAVALVARALRTARAIPVISNDEYAIWGLRGRLLSLAGRFDPRIGLNELSSYPHADYPLTLPALIAWSDRWSGGPNDAAAHAQVVLMFGAMLLVGAWVGSRYGGILGGVAAVALLGGLRAVLPRYAILLFADVPVAAFAVATVAVTAVWLDERDGRLLGVAGVLAAGAALTKNEGALAAVAVLAAAAMANAGRRRAWRPLLAATATVVLAAAPWAVYTRAHGLRSDVANGDTLSPHALRTNAHLVGRVFTAFREFWPGIAGLALLLPLAAALAALANRRWRLVTLFALTLAFDLAGLVVIYLSGFNHLHSSAYRTLIAPAAILAVAVPVLVGAAARRRPEGDA